MIMRLDRLQAEIPPPSDPDPVGASVVQELLGGKFGEMSTFVAPGPEPGEIEEIAAKLRQAAGLPEEPTGAVANN